MRGRAASSATCARVVVPVRAHSLVAALLLALPCTRSKLPYDPLTDHIQHGIARMELTQQMWTLHILIPRTRADCWAPDYCEPEHFYYRLCKLRLRGRAAAHKSEYACPEGEYCEELECNHKCWLPPQCWCVGEGAHEGRMFCTDGECFTHPSTQWGLCRKHPSDDELPPHEHAEEEEPILPTGFHFYTPDELLYNAKLHIDEDHRMARPRVPKPRPKKEEL